MTPDASMNYLFVEFFQGITTGLGYPSALGTGLSDGNYVSGMVQSSATYVENCVLRVSTSALVSGIFCQTASSSSTSAQTFYLTNIKNPSSATTAYYQAFAMSFSTSTTNVHGFIKGSLGIVATVSTTANALPSLTTTTVQNSATWSFQSMVSTQLVSGDKVFIDFTNNRAAFQTSTAAISSGITSMLVFTNVPGIYATVSSQAPAVIMNNPSYAMSAVIKLSSYFGQSLVQVATSASMTFSQGTLTAAITTPQAPTVPFTVSVSIF